MPFSTPMQARPLFFPASENADEDFTSHLSVLLIVQFETDSETLREIAVDELHQRNWQPVDFEELDGFVRQMPGHLTDSDAIRLAERDAAEAAEATGIEEWDAICVLSPPTEATHQLQEDD